MTERADNDIELYRTVCEGLGCYRTIHIEPSDYPNEPDLCSACQIKDYETRLYYSMRT